MRSPWFALTALFALAACQPPGIAPPESPQGYNPGQWNPQGQAPPQGFGPPGYGPQMPPQGYPQGYPPQMPPQQYAQFPVQDPINNVDLEFMRRTAQGVLGELVAALPPAAQAKVVGIPFKTESTVGEVNAYAGCEQRMPFMAITDGLLQTEAYIAQLRATDEIFGTRKLDVYLQAYARDQKEHEPIVAPAPGLIDPAQHVDPRKVARQHQLFEEQVAFVLGHELGHHHLGHTGCANGRSGDRPPDLTDLLRIGTKVVPIFNQPNELDADKTGVDDVLAAGARRAGYHWTEQGALLTLYFFSQLQKLNVNSLARVFLSTHPNPAFRVQPLQQEVARFRATGQWYQPILPLP